MKAAVVLPGEERSVSVLGVQVEILLTGKETGATVSLPRGVPHYFRCIGNAPGIMFGVATPAGHERFFEEASELAFPPDPAEAAVCARHGLELLPPK